MDKAFDYGTAFSRNIGWVTQEEQAILRTKRIAIGGMGGVGGKHLLTLTRMGVGAFHIADFDAFELANFNRQAGATIGHLGRAKVDVLAEMALDINPSLDIRRFPYGLDRDHVAEFLADIDLYIDGLDFFALDIRRAVFAACAAGEIPAMTAAPLGMGVALLNFLPGQMTFEDYFRLEGQPENEQILRFLLGLSPAMLQRGYLADRSAVDLSNHRGPSTPMACDLCAGLAATEALKILLHRGKVWAAPHGLHFDAYRNKFTHTLRPGGNKNWLQRVGIAIARRQLMSKDRQIHPMDSNRLPLITIEHILDLARWAPSGDNTQPWRFQIINGHHCVIHGFDTREHCVYDLAGRASQLAIGALLENIQLAATAHQLKARFERRSDYPDTRPTIDVRLDPDEEAKPAALLPYIAVRAVQRRPMSSRRLRTGEKKKLEQAIAPDYQVIWLEGAKKWRTASLMFRNAKVRLTMPEAYEVHRSVIAWRSRFSDDKIPDQAVGSDPILTRIMQWGMGSWRRIEFFNTYFAGTLAPRIELDWLPGIFCAAHFALLAPHEPATIDDYLTGGRMMQRFWLTATQLGLHIQPEMTPWVFSNYLRQGIQFTRTKKVEDYARRIARDFNHLLGESPARRVMFIGRIGSGDAPKARSLRLPLSQLLVAQEPVSTAAFSSAAQA